MLRTGRKSPPCRRQRPFQLFFFRCLVNQVHELVELRSDDDLRATVALLAQLGVIGGHGVILSAATSGQTLGGHTESGLKILDNV